MNCSAIQFDDSSALVGDPVDVISGANLDRTLDFQMTGPIRLLWVRHYDSSQNQTHYALGWGHTHDFDHWLRFDVDGVRYTGPLGRTVGFPPLTTDSQRFARGGVVLHRVTSGLYRIYRHAEPAMEFEFRDQPAVPLTRLTRGKSCIRLYYDEMNYLQGITDAANRQIRVSTDDTGRILSLIQEGGSGNPDRPLLSYQYDDAGNLVWGEDPYRNSFSFQYDRAHHMTVRRDRKGYSFLFEYDKDGRCARSTGEDGLLNTQLQYYGPEKVTIVTRADGGQWTYLYPTGKLTRIIDPYGGSRELTRDESGRIIEEVDPIGNVTRRVYNSTGALVGKVSPLNRRLPVSEAVRRRDPNRRTLPMRPMEWEYGHVYGRVRPREAITIPRPHEVPLKQIPDRIKQQIRTYDPELQSGNSPAAPLRPGGRVYDDFGKLVKLGGPDGTARRWLYDGNGNVARITDCDGSQYAYKRASWNLRSAVINPLGSAVGFQYTKTEKLSAFKDGGGSLSEYEHDLKDRLVRIRRHGVVKEEYRYDPADNLIEKLDGNGQPLLSIEIGPGNLRKCKRLASGQMHAFGYDKSGRLLSAVTDTAEVLLAYDKSGNKIKDERNGLGIAHRYKMPRSLVQTTYFKRYTVSYNWLGKGTLSIADPRGITHSIEALGSGLVVRRLGCGSSETAQFDERGCCLMKATTRRRADLWLRKYSYSGEGDLLVVEDSVRGMVRYRCDGAHRLIDAELPGGQKQTFEYDVAGNLLRQPGLEGVVLSAGNRLGEANGDRFEYNDRNHIASRSGNSGTTRFLYDALDKLTSVETPNLHWAAEYDALGRRISKSIGERNTEFYWDRERLVAELRSDGSLRMYVYPDDIALTPFMFLEYESLEAAPESGQGYYIHCDHHGAPLLVEDDSGRTVWSARIDPYGFAHVDRASTIELSLRFPGHYFDPETELHCNGFRYYSPELGRYLQSDPIGINGGPNLYAYTSNPLKFVDLQGLGCGDEELEEPDEHQEGTDEDEVEPWEAQLQAMRKGRGTIAVVPPASEEDEPDTSRGPMVGDVDEDAMIRTAARNQAMQDAMTDQEEIHTVYSAAEVRTADGEDQVQIAAAGGKGDVPPRIRQAAQDATGDEQEPTVVKNKDADATSDNRANDAEQTIGRDAKDKGSDVQAIGATRDMCTGCQEAADEDGYGDRVATGKKGHDHSDE